MVSIIKSISVNWLKPNIIDVEVDISRWLPSFTIVWLPDQWVQESRERIRSAIKSSNLKFDPSKITVNLAPADIRKTWPNFDLPIAIWILFQLWFISSDILKDSIFIWELSLDWSLRCISWILPIVIWAREKWYKTIFIPKWNWKEVSIIPGISIMEVSNLLELCNYLNWLINLVPLKNINIEDFWDKVKYTNNDFKFIVWQKFAKRAMEIASAWSHNLVMDWPPGSWKTMLSKAFSSILPKMDLDEILDVSKIYSINWLLSQDKPLVFERPFRTIHHTASKASIIWWWRDAKPWEISLAHRGVLFLDELLEFNKNVLEVLRQPIEDGNISVNRVSWSFTYPSKFIFLWAMNPCPCWYLTDPDKDCICSKYQVDNYRSKLSWPLIDRVDLFINIPKVKIDDLKNNSNFDIVESSKSILERVERARIIQLNRFNWNNIKFNSEIGPEDIKKFCILDNDTKEVLDKAISIYNLSARWYNRILKLSRTIADLDWEENILKKHLVEALSYRKKEI